MAIKIKIIIRIIKIQIIFLYEFSLLKFDKKKNKINSNNNFIHKKTLFKFKKIKYDKS